MALSINQVTLTGNLVRDAEYRTAASGTTVCTFSIAVSKRVKDQSGNWTDEADFFDCVLFGRLGDAFRENNSLLKGTPVVLDGRLQQERWQNREGENRTKVSVIANTVIPYPRRSGGGSSYNSAPDYGQQQNNFPGGQQQGGFQSGGYQSGGQQQGGYQSGFQQDQMNPAGNYNQGPVYNNDQGIQTKTNITEDDIPF